MLYVIENHLVLDKAVETFVDELGITRIARVYGDGIRQDQWPLDAEMIAITRTSYFNRRELLHRLLAQLNAQPSLRNARVVITLNLADEPFDAAPYGALDLRVLRNDSPKGFGANHNAAFALCESPWFGILNPDLALVDQEPFTAMLAGLAATDRDDRTGLIAPRVVSADLAPEDSVRANLTPWSLMRRAMGHRAPLQVSGEAHRGGRFFWVAGMCLLARAEAYQSIGGFGIGFFLGVIATAAIVYGCYMIYSEERTQVAR